MNEQNAKNPGLQLPESVTMPQKEKAFVRFLKMLKPYSGRIIWILCGLITAILFLNIGFWKTILIVLLALLGYAIGVYKDNPVRFIKWLNGIKRFSR